MKTGKIIKKNIKLLLRSRVSTLVLILGPLLVILLVGISFSTSTFNLNMGVYSEKYSNLSTSFTEKLNSEGYSITKYESENLCIEGVKGGQTHACIVFPPDLTIENDKTNVIKFHVDQSKINLVYLVMSTLTSSFGERTQEISKDLTGQIINTLFTTKTELEESGSLIQRVITKNTDITKDSESSITSLDNLDLSSGSNIDTADKLSSINTKLNSIIDDSMDFIDTGIGLIDDMRDYDVDPNQTSSYNNDVDELETTFMDLNTTIRSSHNSTAKELNKFIEDINDEFEDISAKLEAAQTVSTDVLSKLSSLKSKSSDLKDETEKLNTNLKNIISSINAVQITDTEQIVSPISTEISPIVKSQTNLGFLFPSLIVMLIMFIGLLLPSTLIIMEKNSSASFRIFTTPTKNWLFVLGTFLTCMLLIFFQVFIILTVSQFYFKINFMHSITLLIFSLFVIMAFFILLGMLIGYVLNSEELSMLASISLGSLFLLTSGIIFPLESMPDYIIDKAKFNPVVLGSDLFKKSILFGSDFSAVKSPLGYLFGFSVLLVICIFFISKAKHIELILKKPSKLKMKKDWLSKQFDFGERKAKTLPEFIVSIQNLSQDKFNTLLKQSAYRDWLIYLYKNQYLAKKIESLKTKKEIIETLVLELKALSDKNSQKPK